MQSLTSSFLVDTCRFLAISLTELSEPCLAAVNLRRETFASFAMFGSNVDAISMGKHRKLYQK